MRAPFVARNYLNFIVGAITFHSFSQLKYVDVDVDVIISRESFMYVRIE